jgi:hypothetical protein
MFLSWNSTRSRPGLESTVKRRRTDEARGVSVPEARAVSVPEARAVSVPEARASSELDAVDDDELDGDASSTVDTEPVAEPATEPEGLDERARQMLAFERQWWKHAGAKEQAIRDTFGLSATRYYQVLNALLEDPAALAHDPVLVRRLRRLRASRTRRTP